MAKFSPVNRGGNVRAVGKAGGASGFGNWLGKLGQATLGMGRTRLMIGLANQRFAQRQQLAKESNAEWDRRRGIEKEEAENFIRQGLITKKKNPGLTSISKDKLTFSGREVKMQTNPAKPKKPRQPAQGPTNQIIALRKAHEAGDGVMSHEDAMGHRGYRTAFQAHIKAGGTEQNFLDNYTPMGNKSRRKNPGDNRNDNFNGGGNN